MQFAVLGSLEVRDGDGHPIDLTSRRQRRLLAALLINAGSVVSDERLTEMVWDTDELPEGGIRSLRTVVSRLRSAVDGSQVSAQHLLTRPPGYVLELNGSTLDALTFEHGVSRGHRLLAEGDTAAAIEAFDDALRCWRGGAYAEFASEEWAIVEATRLEELRAAATEARFDARLLAGAHAESVGELERHVAAHPFRERPRVQLITALYRSGRQTEALRAYHTYREVLADELGLEPSAALREVELQILRQDRALETPTSPAARVKSYELVERIGRGAWGEVWRARQAAVDRDVAMKIIRPHLADDADFIRRFEVEARLVAGLEHPHITPLYDYWRDPSGAYLVMRLLRGGSAADRLRAIGPWPLPAVATLVDQVASALDAAHRAGVVHRDVKPSNIMLDGDANAYLSDFGVAQYQPSPSAPGTRPAELMTGTLAYAAPEQLAGGDVGPPTDVYGLAVTVWELLCGRLPDGDPEHRHQLPPLQPHRPELADELSALLRQATHADPARRFTDVSAFVAAFRDASNATPLATRGMTSAGRAMPSAAPTNPYKGLRPFGPADAGDFYGRTTAVARVLEAVRQQRFVALVGPSGAGKSSVAQAGLLPALREGGLPGSEQWFVISMTPGRHPFEELEAALLHVAVNPPASLLEQLEQGPAGISRAVRRTLPGPRGQLLLLIDQFEELYTQSDPDVAARFVEGLAQAVDDETTPLRVVLTLRADFFDRPLSDHRLAARLGQGTLPLGAMTLDELSEAITGPAARAGLEVEPALVRELVAGAAGEPAALPLLQYLLSELFEHREGNVLSLAAYERLGGLRGAIAQRAEQLYDELDDAGRAAARVVFGRLVSPGDGSPDTRRRVRRHELEHATTDGAADDVVTRFGAGRLLAFDRDPATREPTVQISHEALLDAWPRLRAWLDEDRDVLRSVHQLTASAAAWEAAGRDDSDLLRGARLAQAIEVTEHAGDRLSPSESSYVAASRAADEREHVHQRRVNRRLRRLLVAVGAFLVVALVAGGLALEARTRASATAYDAETRRLVAEAASLADKDQPQALLLALEARRREQSPSTLAALQRVFALAPVGWMGAITEGVGTDVAFLPDGRLVDTATDHMSMWDMEHRVLLWRVEGTSFGSVSASPDGSAVGVGLSDGGWEIRAAATGTVLHSGAIDAGTISSIRFDPTGRVIALGTGAGSVLVLDARAPGQARSLGQLNAAVTDMAFSADGSQLVAVAGPSAPTGLWEVASGEAGAELPGPDPLVGPGAHGAAFVDGQLWLAGNHLIAVDPVTGASIGEPVDLGEHMVQDEWEQLVLAPVDGRIVVAGYQRTVAVDGRGAVEDLGVTPNGLANRFAIDPGHRLVARIESGIELWSLDGGGFATVAAVPSGGGGALLSADGTTLVSTGPGSTAVWTLGPTATTAVAAERADLFSVFVAGDTVLRSVATPDAGFRLDRWNPSTGRFEVFAPPIDAPIRAFAYAADDRYVVRPRGDGGVDVHAQSDAHLVASLSPFPAFVRGIDFVSDIEFSPDGTKLVIATVSDGVAVYDVATWQLTHVEQPAVSGHELEGSGFEEIAFLPDGRTAVTESIFLGLTRRDTTTWEVLADGGHVTSVLHLSRALDISRDGTIVELSGPGGVQLFDAETLAPLGSPYRHDPVLPVGPAATFAHDADRLATVVGSNVVVWNLDVSTWEGIACRMVGTNLTEEQWKLYGLPGERRKTCEQWPLL